MGLEKNLGVSYSDELSKKSEISEAERSPEQFGKYEETSKLPDEIWKGDLSDAERELVAKETGWSDEIVDRIKSMEQYDIYKNADLKETKIGGRECLVKDIDLQYTDIKTIDERHPDGLSNRDLMEKGRSPYDAKTGERLELHHMGQDFNSPFAELCENSEHGDGNDGILHNKQIESWRQDPEKKYLYNNVQRPNYWKERVDEM